MDVVGNQDIGVNIKLIASPVVFDSLQVVQAIPVVAKDLLALIAADNDVIECPFEFHPRFPGHAGEHIRRLANKSILRSDPKLPNTWEKRGRIFTYYIQLITTSENERRLLIRVKSSLF